MDLIIGGAYQGKLAYAMEHFHLTQEDLARRPQMQPAAMRFPTLSLALFHRNRKSYYQVFIFYSQSVCNVLLKNHGKLCTAPTFVLY